MRAIMALAAGWPLGACLSEAPESALPVRVLASAQHCTVASGVSRIDSEKALHEAVGDTDVLARTDFSRDLVLAVSMGQRPSAGYRLELASDTAEVKEGHHSVQVRMIEPAADAMTAQVLTAPCLAIAISRAASRVRVEDLSGKPIGTIESVEETAP